MPRTDIPVQKITVPNVLNAPTKVNSDSTNNHSFKNTGQEILHYENTGAGAVQITIQSVAGDLQRTGNLVQSVGAGENGQFSILPVRGFNQTDSVVHVDVDTDTDLKLWVTKSEGA